MSYYHLGVEHSTRTACTMRGAAMWQNLMLSGHKVDAIKVVRTGTGFGLKEAKDAVEYWYENRHKFAGIVPSPMVWDVPGGDAGTTRRVIENADGTFTLEIVRAIKCRNLGELLSNVASI